MRLPSRLTAAALALGLTTGALSACGHAAPRADLVQAGPEARLEGLTALDRRVAGVAWRLALANADLCPVVRPRAGWSLQSARQYGPELRPIAERRFGLEGDLPGVLAAPPLSPAAAAGLGAGDLILAVNGQALAPGSGPGAGSYDGLQAHIAVLDQAAARGPVALRVRRGGVERAVTLRPVPACAYATQVEVTGTLRSRADGRHVLISDGMANLAGNDDELAFVLAHELAHAVLEHRTDPAVTGARGEANGRITLRRGLSLSAEADADRMGLYLLARAGFEPHAAVEFLTRYAEADSGAGFVQVNAGGIYASAPDRRRALGPVLADIAARRQANRPLIP